jgi:hypothetical protein
METRPRLTDAQLADASGLTFKQRRDRALAMERRGERERASLRNAVCPRQRGGRSLDWYRCRAFVLHARGARA